MLRFARIEQTTSEGLVVMTMKYTAGCRFFSVLIGSLTLSASLAMAETVTLDPMAYASARDRAPYQHAGPDGDYEDLYPEPLELFVNAWDTHGWASSTAARLEFILPPELLQPGVTINQARLVVPIVSRTLNYPGTVYLAADIDIDDVITLEDFEHWDAVPAQLPLVPGTQDPQHEFDLAGYLLTLGGMTSQRIGFMGHMGGFNNALNWSPASKLQVEYSPASPTLPGLSVFSPLANAEYLEGSEIRLRGKVSDAQDGVFDASIEWRITNAQGSVVWQAIGGDFTTQLPIGTYQVTATVTDSDANTVTQARNVSVVPIPDNNIPPTVTLVSPTAGLDLLAGIPTPLRATATDPEDGDVTASIIWGMDGQLLGRGPNQTATLPQGTHTLMAAAFDSQQRAGEKVFDVNVLPARNYCAVRGPTNTTRWITRISLNAGTQLSQSNNGYGNFTGTWFNAVKGNNPMYLGSTTANRVYWAVWIDLNHDGTFGAGERLIAFRSDVGSSGPKTLQIPATAMTGITRMRVAMTLVAPAEICGVNTSGEFEDYTIVIK
jgi:hypothetical protein